MTGAGIAMPLLGATGAQAADLDTWDRVAQCESGGLWSADTGNGYYGGLQLTQETWEAYGGTVYAERPDLASRSQQIAVAEKILAEEGPDAWPTCGVNAGLRYDSTGEAPAIDPGNILPSEEESASPSTGRAGEKGGAGKSTAPEGGTEKSAEDTGEGEDAAKGTAKGADAGREQAEEESADGSAEKAPRSDAEAREEVADPGAGTGRHRGERDPRELESEGAERSGGREAARGERSEDVDDRTDRSLERAEAVAGSGGEGPLAVGGGYLVRPGDSLSAIARDHEVRGGWTELYEANRDVVGDDPNLILPGQELAVG
ncbi:transglycosylase family protein [Streptomyces macrosporus]